MKKNLTFSLVRETINNNGVVEKFVNLNQFKSVEECREYLTHNYVSVKDNESLMLYVRNKETHALVQKLTLKEKKTSKVTYVYNLVEEIQTPGDTLAVFILHSYSTLDKAVEAFQKEVENKRGDILDEDVDNVIFDVTYNVEHHAHLHTALKEYPDHWSNLYVTSTILD